MLKVRGIFWFSDKRTVGAYVSDRGRRDLVGMFYLKANFPGRAGKVANAGFIVAPEWRSQGLGRLLGTTMLEYAKSLGFHSVLFNLVFSENHASRRLWEETGFRGDRIRSGEGNYLSRSKR